MTMGQERTKQQLYNQAKRLGVKGRSKMNKGQLKAALARKGPLSLNPDPHSTALAKSGAVTSVG
jgi:hypothetical protein